MTIPLLNTNKTNTNETKNLLSPKMKQEASQAEKIKIFKHEKYQNRK